MNILRIYHGGARPIVIRGRNACALVAFAEKFKGWHSLGKTRADRNALAVAVRAGCVDVDTQTGQFRFKYPGS